MKFDYTYIAFRDFLVFEPMIIVSNLVFLVLSAIFFVRLIRMRTNYSTAMAWFMLMLGVGAIFGALCHSIHYQLGAVTFERLFFFMNAFSLMSIFFCFRATFIHDRLRKPPTRWVTPLVIAWISVLLVYSYLAAHFLLITIHAGITLIYSLAVHIRAYRQRNERGSLLIVWGIISSFLSIIVHSAHISFHEWFNYKDFAHVFMIVAMVLIFSGARRNAPAHFTSTSQTPA